MFGNARAQNSSPSQQDGVALNGTFPSIAEPPSPPPVSTTPPTVTSIAPVADGNTGQVGQDTTMQSQAPGMQTPTSTQVQPAVQPIIQPVVEPAAQPVAQPEPSLEFKKGPFDEPEDTTGKTAVDGVVAQDDTSTKPAADMSDDEKTKALRKSLGLDEAGVKQSPVAKPADEATFPSVAQLDQAGGTGMSPVPAADTNTTKGNVNELEKLMDEIVWDLAGVQAKIRQLKDKMEEGSQDSATTVANGNVSAESSEKDVREDSKKASQVNVEPEKPDSKDNPLAGYKI